DGRGAVLPDLVGPVVSRREITELSGLFLADYRVERLYVELTEEEAERYRATRDHYRQFCADRGISLGAANGLARFIQESCRSREGRAAFQAFREQRRIA